MLFVELGPCGMGEVDRQVHNRTNPSHNSLDCLSVGISVPLDNRIVSTISRQTNIA